MALIAVFYASVLPLISNAVSGGAELESGVPYAIGDGVEIVPQDGWRVEPESDSAVTLTKDGAVMVVIPPSPREDLDKGIAVAIEGFENDPRNDWDVGEPEEFTTDAGDDGATVQALSPTLAQQNWWVADESFMVTVVGTAPDSVWPAISAEMDDMVRSIVFAGDDE